MIGRRLATVALSVLLAATLASCGKQEEAKVDKAAEQAAAEAKAAAEANAQAEAKAKAEAEAKEKAGLEAGVEAVVYGLPLVIMDITRERTTNVAKPEGFAAPVNQFINVREFPDA